MANGEKDVKKLGDMSSDELGKVLDRSVVTSIYSHGELVYEPGMSREEERIRSRYALWRHGEEQELGPRTDDFVRRGLMTPEQAEAHKARQRAQAEHDRVYVEQADEARAARLATKAKPHDDGRTR